MMNAAQYGMTVSNDNLSIEEGLGHALMDPKYVEDIRLIGRAEDLSESRLRRAADLWFHARRADMRVDRIRMNLPFSLKDDLPQALLYDVAADGRYRFRLVGSTIVDCMGHDCTGQLVEDVLDVPFSGIVSDLIDFGWATCAPVYAVLHAPWRTVRKVTQLFLPIQDGQRNQVLALSDITYHDNEFVPPNRLTCPF